MKTTQLNRIFVLLTFIFMGGSQASASNQKCEDIFQVLESTRFGACLGERNAGKPNASLLSFPSGYAFAKQAVTHGGKVGSLLSFRIGRSRSSGVDDVGYAGSTIACRSDGLQYTNSSSGVSTTIHLKNSKELTIKTRIGQDTVLLLCQ